MEKLRKLWKTFVNPETISYLIFGVLTTVINIASFNILNVQLHWSWQISNMLAWLIAVIFAFITNKLFVFQSKSFTLKLFLWELITFFGARLLSLGVDMLGMWILLDLLGVNSMIAKVLVNVLVIIINYVLSKLIIFKKK
jgi:putative flippase GtrA